METHAWPASASGYELIAPIGQGAQGLIWKGICRDPNFSNHNKECAIKMMNLKLFQDGNMQDIRKEIQIMS